MDFTVARALMVESQIRTNKVVRQDIHAAFNAIPREKFVPAALQSVAYIDEEIKLSENRYLLEPMVFARLIQEANITKEDAVLDIGCGYGYSSAVIAQIASAVIAVESEPEMAASASSLLPSLDIYNVVVVEGALQEGYASQAPYEVIMIAGAVNSVPAVILDQLAEGGRLITIIRSSPYAAGVATLFLKQNGKISSRALFDANVPILSGFEQQEAFVF